MFSLLLAIIYLAFVSLGLPDSLLGSAWPIMHVELGVSLSSAGIITMIIACGTVISSLLYGRLSRKLGTGLITALSVTLTALAMLGFSLADNFIILCLLAIPYGIGAGAIDAALNNYVALHYSSKHMSWLHCFWGVGTIISPYIMGYALSSTLGWTGGYKIVFIIQIVFSIILFISLPLWKRGTTGEEEEKKKSLSLFQTLKINGVPFILIAFFSYSAVEQTAMAWASSYFVNYKNVDVDTAATFAALFCFGITFGRLLSGFITEKLGDRKMIKLGLTTIIIGIILLVIPLESYIFSLIGFIFIGLGCAPIYPAIIHSTPTNFGKENSKYVIGVQMASAYIGTTFMSSLFGLIAQYINIGLLPLYLFLFTLLMIIMFKLLYKSIKSGK